MKKAERIVAVVVAYNRAKLLAECLNALSQQTRLADEIVVINNASTDQTQTVAKKHAAVSEVITLQRNTGGAGGFAAGIARAVNHWNADFVWIMDDDTIPTSTALEELLAAYHSYPGSPALLASKAVWTDGAEHPMNRPRSRPLLAPKLAQHAQQINTISIRTASFVSIMIDARAIRAEGLPEAAYFLWNDDFEYTSRILQNRIGLYVPASVVIHKTAKFGNSSANPGARFENEVRNKIWAYRYSSGLYLVEKLLYGGKTALRWGKLLTTAPNRAELCAYAQNGLKASLRPPTPVAEIFHGTAVEEDVKAVEHTSRHNRIQACDINSQRQFYDAKSSSLARYEEDDLPHFSVLMSVYAGDDPEHFRLALRSVSIDQELSPSQIVLVQDGEVGTELAEAISEAEIISGQNITYVYLQQNSGLAAALDLGLEHCDYDIVARQDADDISLPQRFSRQIPLMKDLDILGAALTEFSDNPTNKGLTRTLPTDDKSIRAAAVLRDPFNHPTVVLRKQLVQKVGGYAGGERMEDYWLFARMLQAGARSANLPESLVLYRIGAGAYKRRGGIEMACTEMRLQHKLHSIGITNNLQYVRNVLIRLPYRLIPAWLRKALYHHAGNSFWFKKTEARTVKKILILFCPLDQNFHLRKPDAHHKHSSQAKRTIQRYSTFADLFSAF